MLIGFTGFLDPRITQKYKGCTFLVLKGLQREPKPQDNGIRACFEPILGVESNQAFRVYWRFMGAQSRVKATSFDVVYGAPCMRRHVGFEEGGGWWGAHFGWCTDFKGCWWG